MFPRDKLGELWALAPADVAYLRRQSLLADGRYHQRPRGHCPDAQALLIVAPDSGEVDIIPAEARGTNAAMQEASTDSHQCRAIASTVGDAIVIVISAYVRTPYVNDRLLAQATRSRQPIEK
jgi:hypothetical protein